MEIKEIKERYNKLNIFENRGSSEVGDERVFYNQDLDKWNNILTDIFGPPIKPPGVRPNKEHLDITIDHGGILQDQTLFKKDLNEAILIAMLWPWQDKIHTTLKTVLLKK